MSSTPILAKITVSAANTAERTAQTCQEGKASGLMNDPSNGAGRHCEERSDEAIQISGGLHGLLRFARNDGERQFRSSGSTGSGATSTPSSISARASSGDASP